MKVKASSLMGRKIIAVKEDAELGEVKDFIYNPDDNKITGFIVNIGGVLAETQVLPFNEIQEITPEMILAKSKSSIKPASKAITPSTKSDNSDTYMQGTDIKTPDGNVKGKFKDLYFDSKSGKVLGFETNKGSQSTEVPIKEVVVSTDKETIVKETNSDDQSKKGVFSKITEMMGI